MSELKTEYKYIRFQQAVNDKKLWRCFNIHHGEQLGQVAWYAPWRQWIYEPVCPAVYSVGCLTDILDFIKQLAATPKDIHL